MGVPVFYKAVAGEIAATLPDNAAIRERFQGIARKWTGVFELVRAGSFGAVIGRVGGGAEHWKWID